MGGKRLSAADRLLGTGNFASDFISDFPELVEEDIWGDAGIPYSAAGTRWSRRQWGGGREQPSQVGRLSMDLDAASQDLAVRRLHGNLTASVEKSEPMSVPECERTGGSEEEEAAVTEDDEWVPPHEYVARVHGKSEMSTSVFEGVGRKLKGRDLSRVRDSVWSRTGFFG